MVKGADQTFTNNLHSGLHFFTIEATYHEHDPEFAHRVSKAQHNIRNVPPDGHWRYYCHKCIERDARWVLVLTAAADQISRPYTRTIGRNTRQARPGRRAIGSRFGSALTETIFSFPLLVSHLCPQEDGQAVAQLSAYSLSRTVVGCSQACPPDDMRYQKEKIQAEPPVLV